ncbi:MAG: hypothetical protein HY077_11050 [Elusimicrobia bacterium]|nr:hypothetical protein [Elusimicrobiota bacterium]
MASATLKALLVSAQLMGISAVPVPPAASPRAVPPKGPVKEVLRIPLSEITRNQERAWVYEQAGRGTLGFCAALDPKADFWIKLRQNDRFAAHPLNDFEAGVEEDFPSDRYKIVLENGMLRAFPVDPPQSPQAHVSTPALLRGLYETAEHVLFTPVEYAVAYEDGGLVPASVSLIREDNAGRFFVSYHSKAELSEIQWFVSIDGTMYGMKLEGDDLVFSSEPTPALAKKR